MGKKWLWFAAAAVIAGACACSGGEAGKENKRAEESVTAGDETGGLQNAEGEEEVSESGYGNRGEDDGGTDDADRGEKEEGQNPAGKKSEEGEKDEEYGDFRTGTWDGLTFSNPWLNITITFPEGSAVFSEEDMKKLVGESSEIVVNSGNYEDIRSKASDALNIYDFMVTMPDQTSSVQLAYMNAGKMDLGQEISAEDCLNELAGELSAIKDMGYELGEIEKAEIGGKVFDRFCASLMGGALYQEYYAVRAGDYVAMLTATYEKEGKAAVEMLIEGITKIP